MPQESPPAKMAPACAMNHSGALKPRIPTEWCLSRPSLTKERITIKNREHLVTGNIWSLVTSGNW